MASREQIVFQPYVTGARGSIKPGTPIACRNAEDGQRRAEKAMEAGSAIGAHVVRMQVDEDAGDYGDPEYLVTLGRVPGGE